MFARHIACTAAILEAANQTRRAVVQCRAIGRFFRQALFDIPSNDLRQRQAPLARLGSQAPRLPLCQLDLRSYHKASVSTP